MAERARIARYLAPLCAAESGSFDLTDDAAVLTPPAGQLLVVTTDSVIETIHVFADATPQQFAQKLMRRNLSDLAAMGATPWRYTLNVHTPRGLGDDWFVGFAIALEEEQTAFNLTLIGGDSTSGDASAPIHVTMTCFGLLAGAPLRRNGAQVGDDLYVSGTIGDAALGLHLLQQNSAFFSPLVERYHRPEPRITLGLALQGITSAAIDISDGLLADSAQLCTASNVGARIQRALIPRSSELQQFLDKDTSIWDAVLNGGDDYELCFTAAPSQRAAIDALAQSTGVAITRIGEITAEEDIVLLDENGAMLTVSRAGWEH